MTALTIIRRHVHASLLHLIDNDATTLRDLRLDGVDRVGIAMDIEDDTGGVIADEHGAWDTVADVVRCYRRLFWLCRGLVSPAAWQVAGLCR
jgi:acyl carrier protein